MNNTIQAPFIKCAGESFLILLICASIAVLAMLFIPAIIFLPAPLIYITVKRGFFFSFMPLAAMTAAIWFLSGMPLAVVFFLLFAPPVYIVANAIDKKTRSFESVILSVGACVLGLGLIAAYFHFILKTDMITYVLKLLEGFLSGTKGTAYALLQLINIEDILTGVKNINAIMALPEAEAVEKVMSDAKSILSYVLPIIFSGYSIMGGLFNYVIPRAVLKKKGVKVAPIPTFAGFRLPKGFFIGLVIVAVALLLGSIFGIQNYDAVFNACLTAYAIVFIICGISLLDYLLSRRKMNKTGKIVLLTVSAVFFGFILVWVGLFDAVLRIKERMDKPDEFDGE